MPEPRVSILIDNYNYGRYLPAAIDSALNQTFGDCEVVVIDDGSTDDSRQIIAGYGDRIRAVLQANAGQGAAFNAGIAACRGQIICLLDADDYFAPVKVERVVGLADTNPTARAFFHRVQKVDERGGPVGKSFPHEIVHGDIADRVECSGGWWPHPPTSGLAFRRQFLQKILPIPQQTYRTCADAYLAGLAPLLGEVVGSREVLAYYRVHGGNHWLGAAEGTANLERQAQRECLQLETVNAALEKLGSVRRLDLKDHLPYQMLRRRQEFVPSLFGLLQLTLRWRGESFPVRVKMLLRNLWAL